LGLSTLLAHGLDFPTPTVIFHPSNRIAIMSYRVKINSAIAIVENKTWKSSNPTLQSILNNWLEIEKEGEEVDESQIIY
jgi:hypothetical protein